MRFLCYLSLGELLLLRILQFGSSFSAWDVLGDISCTVVSYSQLGRFTLYDNLMTTF